MSGVPDQALVFFSNRMRRWLELAEREPALTEIMYDGGPTTIDIGGEIIEDTDSDLTDAAVYSLASNCAVVSDQVFSRESPMLSVMLPTGFRVTFMRPPAVRRPVMAMRKLMREPIPLSRYVEQGAMSTEQAHELEELVLDARNVLVSGGVGVGKTTLARALLELVPHSERIVTIEDPAEIWLMDKERAGPRRNWVQLEACPAMDMAALLRASLRLRPDRVIVGEVRGPDALEMVRAANVGTRGLLGTIHSDGEADAIERLFTLATETQPHFKYDSCERAIDAVVQVSGRGGRRRVEIWRNPRSRWS